MKAVAGSVASDNWRASTLFVVSKGIAQSPPQSPEGQSEAPKPEQLPAQLDPRPQVATSIVYVLPIRWQQLTFTDSLWLVNTLSKKSIGLAFFSPEGNGKSFVTFSLEN